MPRPCLQRAYSQVPAQADRKAKPPTANVSPFMTEGSIGGSNIPKGMATAEMNRTPNRAETVCTKSIMTGEYIG